MVEVTAQIQFLRECLGSVRRTGENGDVLAMPRAADGRVMFLPNWWRSAIGYAAQVTNRHQRLVNKIDWNPCVDDGELTLWKRWVSAKANGSTKKGFFVTHEVYAPGEVVRIYAVLPSGIRIEEFKELLNVAGIYRGVTPGRVNGENFGVFRVLSVDQHYRPTLQAPEQAEK